MSRRKLLESRCVECGTPDEYLDEHGQCFECSDALVPHPICRVCGNDDGPYGGLCLDCLEADESLADPPDDGDELIDEPW